MSSLYKYKKIEDIPNKISIFPLNGALLLPRSQLPLNIFEPRYLEMVDNAISSDRLIGMIQSQESNIELNIPRIIVFAVMFSILGQLS